MIESAMHVQGAKKQYIHSRPIKELAHQDHLKLLHMDLCGPIRVLSIRGKRFTLVVIDDFSGIHGPCS